MKERAGEREQEEAMQKGRVGGAYDLSVVGFLKSQQVKSKFVDEVFLFNHALRRTAAQSSYGELSCA